MQRAFNEISPWGRPRRRAGAAPTKHPTKRAPRPSSHLHGVDHAGADQVLKAARGGVEAHGFLTLPLQQLAHNHVALHGVPREGVATQFSARRVRWHLLPTPHRARRARRCSASAVTQDPQLRRPRAPGQRVTREPPPAAPAPPTSSPALLAMVLAGRRIARWMISTPTCTQRGRGGACRVPGLVRRRVRGQAHAAAGHAAAN